MAGAPRIDWSHDGRAMLSCLGGTLRRHAVTANGAEVDPGGTIVDGPRILDARWRSDGSIVAVDEYNVARRYHGKGDVIEMPRKYQLVLTAAWIADADVYLALAAGEMFVASLDDGGRRWQLDGYRHGAGGLADRTGGAISGDGRLVAIGYVTPAEAYYTYERRPGRGWIVMETQRDRVLDRSFAAAPRGMRLSATATARFAFDVAGRRFALAVPEPGATIGAIRIGKDERYPREHAGATRAVALDDKGILAAYAYPKEIDVPRRLRVDYLEPGVKGGSKLAIADTLWIDPDLADILALAFDRTSRRIACLDASGRIDVVPVP